MIEPLAPSRRRFVQGLGLAGGATALGFAPSLGRAQDLGSLSGNTFDLNVSETPANVTGRTRMANTVNGARPGPTLYWREGDTVTLNVTNRLKEPTSIHWHGIRLPSEMDGVPGLSFVGIMPGETFTYRFPVKQTGTYWYHSHSGMQEQIGLHGALVLQPLGAEAHPADREHVVVLTDWTDEDPMTVVANLKEQGDYYNYAQRTVGDLAHELKRDGLDRTLRERSMWARMRMTPSDVLDVTGATYTYLANGQPPRGNWTGLFRPGERVKLRIVNASAMTLFDVRIPGLKMAVVSTDGHDVRPVEVDQFRIGTAETYDVIVQPLKDQAYTIFAQAMDRSGFARATLAPRPGMVAEVPPMDPRPVRTVVDMGMGGMGGMSRTQGMGEMSSSTQMGGMTSQPVPSGEVAAYAHNDVVGAAPAMAAGGDMGSMPGMGGANPMSGMRGSGREKMGALAAMAGMSKAAAGHAGAATKPAPGVMPMQMAKGADPRSDLPVSDASQAAPARLKGDVNVDNVAMDTKNRLGEAGDGLEHDQRRTLVYTDLVSLTPRPDPRKPTREVVFHLTGNMQRWTWGFDGKKFSQAPPVHLKLGERVRFILVNDTMMEHPIHLHGLFSEIENGQGEYRPLKHTVIVKPGERMSYLVSADTPGHWAFHCHLLYHMETGMFRTVVVS
jgi:CopA family copper-resistance protein